MVMAPSKLFSSLTTKWFIIILFTLILIFLIIVPNCITVSLKVSNKAYVALCVPFWIWLLHLTNNFYHIPLHQYSDSLIFPNYWLCQNPCVWRMSVIPCPFAIFFFLWQLPNASFRPQVNYHTIDFISLFELQIHCLYALYVAYNVATDLTLFNSLYLTMFAYFLHIGNLSTFL